LKAPIIVEGLRKGMIVLAVSKEDDPEHAGTLLGWTKAPDQKETTDVRFEVECQENTKVLILIGKIEPGTGLEEGLELGHKLAKRLANSLHVLETTPKKLADGWKFTAPSPRPHTVLEMRDEFMRYVIHNIQMWRDKPDPAVGVTHSLLCLLDGVVAFHPAMNLTPAPHPDDKAYHISEGTNYYPDAEEHVVINDCHLHDMLYPYMDKMGIPREPASRSPDLKKVLMELGNRLTHLGYEPPVKPLVDLARLLNADEQAQRALASLGYHWSMPLELEGTRTGRFSAKEPNPSNAPRGNTDPFEPDIIEKLPCKFCGELEQAHKAHLHQGRYVCEKCWDERLRTTE
jgi:hypothetical protein